MGRRSPTTMSNRWGHRLRDADAVERCAARLRPRPGCGALQRQPCFLRAIRARPHPLGLPTKVIGSLSQTFGRRSGSKRASPGSLFIFLILQVLSIVYRNKGKDMPQLRFIHDASWTAVHLALLRAVEIMIVWIKHFRSPPRKECARLGFLLRGIL